MTNRNTKACTWRAAFTLVELLVVISIIALLMALLMPAVQQAREAARRSTCANNLNQMALAMINRVTAKGTFPGAQESLTVAGGRPVTWVVQILPFLEQMDTYDQWLQPTTSIAIGAEHSPFLQILHCPSIGSADKSVATNCYVANAGMTPANAADWWDAQTPANGVFHDHIGNGTNKGAEVSLNDFRNGASNTLLFSENSLNFTHGVTWRQLNAPGSEKRFNVFTWHFRKESGVPTSNYCTASGNSAGAPAPEMRINGMRTVPGLPLTEASARPSCEHIGGVNVAFADRHTVFLSDSIAYHVYQQLMTPNGAKSNMPCPGYLLTDADFN